MIADLAEQIQRLSQVPGRLLITLLPPADATEVGQGRSFSGEITDATGGAAGFGMNGEGVGVMAARLEIAVYGASQADGMTGPAVGRAAGGSGDEYRPLAIEPGARGGGIGYRRNGHGRAADVRPKMPLSRHQGIHGSCRGGDVVIEQPGQRGVSLGVGGRQVSRIGPQQVMHTVAAGAGLVDQVGAGEHVEQTASLRMRGRGKRGGGVGIQIRPGVQAQQAERSGRLGRQVMV